MFNRNEVWYITSIVFLMAFAAGYAMGLWTANVRGIL